METMLYKGALVSILESGSSMPRVFRESRGEHDAFWVKNADLKPVPIKKQTPVQKALTEDPEILAQLAPYVTRIEISSNPNAVDKVAADISANSKLSETDAIDYIQVVSDKSHDAKFDVIVKADTPLSIRERVGFFFNRLGHRAKSGEFQIGSRALALWLMNFYNVMPEKQV